MFKEGVHEKPIYGGELFKKGAWTVCTFKAGGGGLGQFAHLRGGAW